MFPSRSNKMKALLVLAFAYVASAQTYQEYQPDAQEGVRESHGFVEPLDFSQLFGASNFGLVSSSSNVKAVAKPPPVEPPVQPPVESYFESFPLESKRQFQIAESASYHYPSHGSEEAESRYEQHSSNRKPGREADEDDPNCERVSNVKEEDISHGRYRRSPTNCLFCKNPVTGAKYSKCSFNNEPDKKSYFKGASESYSTHSKGQTGGGGGRNRRQLIRYADKPREFDEAIEYQGSSFKEVRRPDDDTMKDFERSYAEEYDKIKEMAQSQAKEARTKPENCKVVKRDDMTCNVCGDDKTGGTFETCSYVSEPKNIKYSYSNDKKYDSNDDDDEEDTEQKEKEGKEKPKPKPKSNRRKNRAKTIEASATSDHRSDSRDGDDSEKEVRGGGKRYEEYYEHLFPEYAASDQRDEVRERGSDFKSFFTSPEPKRDVAKVLAEFAEKDRSACKKIMRDKLTCYRCADKKGAVREECAYSSEGEPKASHMAYTEVKKYHAGQREDDASKDSETAKTPRSGRKRQTGNSRADDGQQIEESIVQRVQRDYRSQTGPISIENAEEQAAQETRPRFSRELGMMLPNYMLEKSEQEKEFDVSYNGGR